MRSIERINAAKDIVTRHDAGFIPTRIAIQIMYDIIMLPEDTVRNQVVSDSLQGYDGAACDSLYIEDEDEFAIADPDTSKDPVFTSFDDEAEAATEELHKVYPPHHDPEAPANIWNPRGKVEPEDDELDIPEDVQKACAEYKAFRERRQQEQGEPTRRQTDALETLQMLEEHGGDMTVAGVAEAMEITAPAAKSLLDALVEKGKITQTKEGRAFHYQIVKG